MFPPFLLAKLYQKGSLKNTATGFEFSLKNIIDSAMLNQLGPITAGDVTYSGAAITLQIGDKIYSGADVSRSNPVPVHMGTIMKVSLTGAPLPSGVQHITACVTTNEIGQVKISFSDTVE
jgi:hydroxymethylglutaryl-CoA reductase (NADPH)